MKKAHTAAVIVFLLGAVGPALEGQAQAPSLGNTSAKVVHFNPFVEPNNTWGLLDVISRSGTANVSAGACGAPADVVANSLSDNNADYTDKNDSDISNALDLAKAYLPDIGKISNYKGVKKISVLYKNPTEISIDPVAAKKLVATWPKTCINGMQTSFSEIILDLFRADGAEYKFEDSSGAKVVFDPKFLSSLTISDEQKAELSSDSSVHIDGPMDLGFKGVRVTENWIPCKKGHGFWCN